MTLPAVNVIEEASPVIFTMHLIVLGKYYNTSAFGWLFFLLTFSAGFSVTLQRQLSWRLMCQKLRTRSLLPSSLYHNWTENTHAGMHR